MTQQTTIIPTYAEQMQMNTEREAIRDVIRSEIREYTTLAKKCGVENMYEDVRRYETMVNDNIRLLGNTYRVI